MDWMLGTFFSFGSLVLSNGHSLYILAPWLTVCAFYFEETLDINLFRFSFIISSFFFFRKLTANSSLFNSGSDISTSLFQVKRRSITYLAWNSVFNSRFSDLLSAFSKVSQMPSFAASSFRFEQSMWIRVMTFDFKINYKMFT